ncbi:DUF971 domain-containing protein [Rhodohalobacter sp. SW132]|uniref:DUF971 domain-containing protein n=1 Tax=Rhodohalobacter sp. SW132 TaxID=2293433 RepID=UPI001F3B5513|nr:DUF971 domain-containing protein [Rhodohalobacter sp. SW132]
MNRNHYSGINKMEKSVQPKSIDVSNSDQELSITWADGHVSQFSLFGLRKNCPCVECRGGHEMMGRFEPELFRVEPTRTYSVQGAETVGNHALKISWDDGHNSGMYRWKLLRQMDEAVQKLDQN